MTLELYKYSTLNPTTADNDSANGPAGTADNIFRGKIWVNTATTPIRQFVCRNATGTAAWQIMGDGRGFLPRIDPATGLALPSVTGAYAPVLADAGTLIPYDTASSADITIPLNTFAVGEFFAVAVLDTGVPTIAGAVSVTVDAAPGFLKTATGEGAIVFAVQVATNRWFVSGDVLAV